MGTNFSFYNKEVKETIEKLQEKYPDLDLQIPNLHIAKTSAGWKPLFNKTKYYSSVAEIYKYYHSDDNILIFDEYGTEYDWDAFVERVINFGDEHNSKCHVAECRETWYCGCTHWHDEEGYDFTDGDWS